MPGHETDDPITELSELYKETLRPDARDDTSLGHRLRRFHEAHATTPRIRDTHAYRQIGKFIDAGGGESW